MNGTCELSEFILLAMLTRIETQIKHPKLMRKTLLCTPNDHMSSIYGAV
jgi:hypothetical protein